MEVTVMTSLFTKRDVNINTTHINTNIQHYARLVALFLVCVLFIYQSKAQQNEGLNQLVDSLRNKGFLTAKLDDENKNVISGKRFIWGKLYSKEIPEDILKKFEGEWADIAFLQSYFRKYVKQNYHNKGYPFASFSLSIQNIENNEVEAVLILDKKNHITYDSLRLSSNYINKKYLKNYLNIKDGENWSTKTFNNISSNIKTLGFLKLHSPPQVNFAKGEAILFLEANPIRNNQFDAILGYVPEDGRNIITGQIDLELSNLFKRAIKTSFNWRSFANSSQVLNISGTQLKAFNSPIGYNTQFNLLKQDSSFINIEFELSANWMPDANWLLSTGYQNLSHNVTSENGLNQNLENSEVLRSSRVHSARIGINYKQPLPFAELVKNHHFSIFYTIGQKEILNFNRLPDDLKGVEQNTLFQQIQLSMSAQYPFFKRTLLQARISSNSLINNALSRNDYLRLGGLNTLRGFNENFLFTTSYQLINFDYRFYLNESSNVFSITDFAYLQSPARFMYAFGLGVEAKTKSGWFRIIYALGSDIQQKVNFTEAKIHLGYIAVF